MESPKENRRQKHKAIKVFILFMLLIKLTLPFISVSVQIMDEADRILNLDFEKEVCRCYNFYTFNVPLFMNAQQFNCFSLIECFDSTY